MSRQILTARQEAFAQEFAKTRSVSRAYRAAYETDKKMTDRQIDKLGRSVLSSRAVLDRVEDLINEAAAATVFTVNEAIARFLMIAMADPNELVSLKMGACRYCHGDGHEYQWREREYLEALAKYEAQIRDGVKGLRMPDVGGGFDFDATREPHDECPECHGEGVHRIVCHDTEKLSPQGKALFCGVKMTNSGPQIIMADRQKALENACRLAGLFKDNVTHTHDLRKMADLIEIETTDPHEAARLYRELVTAPADKPH